MTTSLLPKKFKSRKTVPLGLKWMAFHACPNIRPGTSKGKGIWTYLSTLLGSPRYSSLGLSHRYSGWLCQNSILEREQGQLCSRSAQGWAGPTGPHPQPLHTNKPTRRWIRGWARHQGSKGPGRFRIRWDSPSWRESRADMPMVPHTSLTERGDGGTANQVKRQTLIPLLFPRGPENEGYPQASRLPPDP